VTDADFLRELHAGEHVEARRPMGDGWYEAEYLGFAPRKSPGPYLRGGQTVPSPPSPPSVRVRFIGNDEEVDVGLADVRPLGSVAD
jgi:hypothetical protein